MSASEFDSAGPAGEVGTGEKPCGWQLRLSRQFIGIGTVTDPLGGDEDESSTEAEKEAFLDAAEKAFNYLKEQYDQLECKDPCHKDWAIDYSSANGYIKKLTRFVFDGLDIEEVSRATKISENPLRTVYRASVKLSCHFVLMCVERPQRPAPDVDEILKHYKSTKPWIPL